MKNKKAQGMSINLIVVAAVALLVMVILIAMFSSKIGDFGTQKDGCIAQGGICVTGTGGRCDTGQIRIDSSNSKDCPSPKICCIQLGS